MYILIFANLKQINYKVSIRDYLSLIFKFKTLKKLLKKHIWLTIYPSNKCDLKKIILIKDVQKCVDQKMLKNLMKKKRFFIVYQRTKVQKVGSPKNEGVEKIYLTI